MLAAAKIKFKNNIFTGSESRMIVVEPYSIAQQWCIDSNGWPLQSVITLSGMKKTFKTTTALDFAGLFVKPPVNGKAVVVHCEGKWSDTKVRGLLGEHAAKLITPRAEGIDNEAGWQPMVSHFLNYMEENAPDMPFFVGVDAITGPPTKEMESKIEETGAGIGRSFQDKAQVITTYTSYLSTRIVGFPWIVFLTNHLKEDTNSVGFGKSYHTPGGVAPGFYTSLDIRLRRGKDIDKAGLTGAEIVWEVFLSSIGRDKRRIDVPVFEGYDEAGNSTTWFDWDTALVRLILELQSNTSVYAELKEACQLVEYSATPWPVYSCKQLGITREKAITEKWTAPRIGAALQTDPDMRSKLQTALRIPIHQVWHPGVDWQRNEKRKNARSKGKD